MQNHATIRRLPSTPCGTFGWLIAMVGAATFQCRSLELPWKDNRRSVSCIPTGEYRVEYGPSSKGRRYRVQDVPGRDGILIHPANYAGDLADGLRTDVKGCIGLGMGIDSTNGQGMITNSRQAVATLEAFFQHEPFSLTIEED